MSIYKDLLTNEQEDARLRDLPLIHVQELPFDEYTEIDYMLQAQGLGLAPTYSVSHAQMKQNALQAGWDAYKNDEIDFRTKLHNAVYKPHHKINNMTKSIPWRTL